MHADIDHLDVTTKTALQHVTVQQAAARKQAVLQVGELLHSPRRSS